jgi:hypothetical protein
MVLALGLIVAAGCPLATEFFRTLFGPAVVLATLSRLFLGLEEGVVVMWSFCWCRNKRSRRAKHLAHSGHSNGFSFVCERSWRLRCSKRAKHLWHVPHTWGLGLSVFGGEKLLEVLEFVDTPGAVN